jgi:hypothetical protein
MTTSNHINRISAGIAVALATAATVASVAAAAGDPKNELPFTRAVASRALVQTIVTRHASVSRSIEGEAKNQAPFSRRLVATQTGLVIQGETKNQSPFTRR